MGNLIIKKVRYSGEKYYFESPELQKGINLIVGDNGSGKSTFSYFIEYALGGFVEPFSKVNNKNKNNSKYTLIREDENNYVSIDIEVNGLLYSIKRFIDSNDIFYEEKGVINKLPIYRNRDHAPVIFSDWLLGKLNINVFELSLGSSNWLIGFNDLFRLLNHDQDSNPKDIYKSPKSNNFISDSSIIRKSIFETLVGISSEEHNIKYNAFKKAQKGRDESKLLLDNFLAHNSCDHAGTVDELQQTYLDLEDQLEKLLSKRNNLQQQNTNASEKTQQLTEIQTDLIRLELKVSEDTVKKKMLSIEKNKIDSLLASRKDEISQIEKIIFTHDKLNLFALEICPFCMEEVERQEGYCICGSKIKDNDYEKFVYKSSEYKQILDHKKKSLRSVEIAYDSYRLDILKLETALRDDTKRIVEIKNELESIINSIEFTGNSDLVNRIDNKILEVKGELIKCSENINSLSEKLKLESAFSMQSDIFKAKDKLYKSSLESFNRNNKETIKAFNKLYSELLSKSSCSSNYAEINDDYMPYIDHGEYKERSTIVPIRLMYYFTLLSLGLKRDTVKHPRFLLIDTPEEGGIDKSNLKLNLKLLDDALTLSKNHDDEEVKDFQVILTTGEDKYPTEYEDHIRFRLNKKSKEFILTKRKSKADNNGS